MVFEQGLLMCDRQNALRDLTYCLTLYSSSSQLSSLPGGAGPPWQALNNCHRSANRAPPPLFFSKAVPVFLNVYNGAQKSIPRNEFRQPM
jgi:hypothetical protein